MRFGEACIVQRIKLQWEMGDPHTCLISRPHTAIIVHQWGVTPGVGAQMVLCSQRLSGRDLTVCREWNSNKG